MFHRFYTLDKKPTVWNIAFLTVFMIIGMAVILTRQAISIPWFLAVYIVFHLAVLGMLIRAFFRQLRYDPYSYNTIYYSGFTILMLVYLLQVVFLVSRSYFWTYEPDIQITNLIGLLIGSAKTFMILTSPIVLLFSLALCISNIALIRHEGRRFPAVRQYPGDHPVGADGGRHCVSVEGGLLCLRLPFLRDGPGYAHQPLCLRVSVL